MLQWLFTHLEQMRRAFGTLFSCSDPVVEPEPVGTLPITHHAGEFGFAISCDGQENLRNEVRCSWEHYLLAQLGLGCDSS